MKGSPETHQTNLAAIALEKRRRHRRDSITEPDIEANINFPNNIGKDDEHDPEPEDKYPRLSRQLAEIPQTHTNSYEKISAHRTVRWRLPVRFIAIILALLLITLIYQIFAAKNSSTFDTVETGIGTTETILAEDNPNNTQQATTGSSESSTGKTVWVHVAGAVVSPGIYELPSSARIAEAVEKAGGPRDDADLNLVNLAAHVTDGNQIYIPTAGEHIPTEALTQPTGKTTSPGPQTSNQLVNLNTASQQELETLPRVGPVLAQKIIEWRETNGGFSSITELDAVPGIGPAMMETLTPLVTI